MRFFIWLDKILLHYFNAVISVSRPVLKELRRWGTKDNSILIYNGIDNKKFRNSIICRNEIRKQLSLTIKDIVIGFVGRISYEKGVDNIINCGEQLKKSFPQIQIVIVGDGPLRSELEGLNLDYVHFVGVQDDIASYYSAFDILVLPSLTEGLPMVVLEAMASSLPVVASNVGAIPDVVEDGKTGYLIAPGKKADIYNALEKLIISPDLAREMGKNGAKKVENMFASDKMARQYMAVYDSLE